jgi:chemotaxis protein methyltransferase CheR
VNAPSQAIAEAGLPPALGNRELSTIARLAHQSFGLNLTGDRQDILAARLAPALRELGLSSFRQYLDYLHADRTGAALAGLADRLTTNHTSFFREPQHFNLLRTAIFPALRARPRIDIWSAGCSSGEEPYSIAMSLLEESPRDAAARVRIHATDISARILQRAAAATYSAARVRDIPPGLLRRYLIPNSDFGPGAWRIVPELRELVEFDRLNLIDPLPTTRYPVIFCRNVMLYFDHPTQQDLIQRLADRLEDGGYLFIGHAESLSGIARGLEHVCPAVWRRPGSLRGLRTPINPAARLVHQGGA